MALSKIDVANMLTGATPVANGGTGLSSGTTNQFLKFTGSTTLASAADNAGKVLQVVKSELANTTYTTSSSHGDVLSANITCSNSNNYIFAIAALGTDMYGQSSSEPQGAIRMKFGSSNKADIPLRSDVGTSQYDRDSNILTAYEQAGSTSQITVTITTACDSGRVGLWGTDGHSGATVLTLMEISA